MLMPRPSSTPDIRVTRLLMFVLFVAGVASTIYFYQRNLITSYGDAVGHLNIAKRVLNSLTPGLAHLGGVWLPLPHVLMLPFVGFEPLYRTGLAGSIVSGIAYCITGLYVYKTTQLLTSNMVAAVLACAVFALNPNILYLQSTPMTELPLMACFVISTFFFVKWVLSEDTLSLLCAAFFGFLATLMRYDGWFLVLVEALSIGILHVLRDRKWRKAEGTILLFATLAFFGIGLWLLWDTLILGDPLYFANSVYSAKAQQNEWAARGQLPSYHNIGSSIAYYTVTAAMNSGVIIFGLGVIGIAVYMLYKPSWSKFVISLMFMVPYIFYVVTLFMGQSIILIPQLTPSSFVTTLFNVRYGSVMVPIVAVFVGYLFAQRNRALQVLVVLLVAANLAAFGVGAASAITIDDGIIGESRLRTSDAEQWLTHTYDGGLLLIDDYAKSVSTFKAGIPIQSIIYIGNKPYWENALNAPERSVRWVVINKGRGDALYKNFFGDPAKEANLHKYFDVAFSSPDTLIFRRNTVPITP